MALGVVLSGLGYGVATVLVLAVTATALCIRKKRYRALAFAAGWLSVPAALVLFLLWHSGALGDLVLSSRFDADAWRAKQGAPFDDRTRLRMVKDLRASGRLDRLTQGECLALLGEPSSRQWGSDARTWAWRLGPDRGMGIDSSWLCLRFGADGRVVEHFVAED